MNSYLRFVILYWIVTGTFLISVMLTFPAFQVKEIYGLDSDIVFRNATVSSENRPRPLYLGTATQIGNS